MSEANLGRIIHDRRVELGLTLEQVGNAVGVGKSTVKKWESGFIANMRRDRIAALAKCLQLSPLLFVDETEEPPAVPEVSENKKALRDLIDSVPDDKAELLLRVMKSILQDDS